MKAQPWFAVLALTLVLAAGPRAAVASPVGDQGAPPPPELSAQALANATYQSEFTPSRVVTLSSGVFEDRALPIAVRLGQTVSYGRLNGMPAAAVTLATNTGGSGTFVELAVMVPGPRGPLNVATVGLGDRVQIEALTVADNQVTLEMLQVGPNDPMCCPTQRVRNTYQLNLERTTSEVLGSTSAAAPGSQATR